MNSCWSRSLVCLWRCSNFGTLGIAGVLGRLGGGQRGEQSSLGCNSRAGVLLAFGDVGILGILVQQVFWHFWWSMCLGTSGGAGVLELLVEQVSWNFWWKLLVEQVSWNFWWRRCLDTHDGG